MDTDMAVGLETLIPKGDSDALSARVLLNLGRDTGVIYYPGFWRLIATTVRLLPWWVFRRTTG